MSSHPAPQPSVWSDIHRALLAANILITAVAVGVHAAALKALGVEEFVEFAHILGRTAPLCIAVAVIVFLILRQHRADDWNLGITLVVAAGILFVATWLANWLGDLRVTAVERWNVSGEAWGLGTAIDYLVAMLGAYYRAYGPPDFWSSVVVGITLSFIWHRVIEHWSQPLVAPTPLVAPPPSRAQEAEVPRPRPARSRRKAA